MDLARLRAETPGCAERIHLNNAGAALMPAPVRRAIDEHLDLEGRIGGYEAAEARRDAISGAYEAVAGLIGTRPRNIAFTENATASYIQALSAVPFERGDVILTTRNDYASNQIQFLSLQKRLGIKVLRAPDSSAGGVDVTAMEEMIHRHRPRMVCVTHVPTNSGLVQDIGGVGAACRKAETLYMVDACQSVGQMPIDVDSCDFLSATARKFLRGPRGAGFLYVSDRVLEQDMEPLFIDMRGADWTADGQYIPAADATRFENWEFAYALVLATGVAARYASAIGLDVIRDRVRSLADRMRTGLSGITNIRVLDRGAELCAIVSASIDGWDPGSLVESLRRRGINTTGQFRPSAVLDYDDKAVEGSLRLSPHYYNTEDEIDRCLAAIGNLAGKPAGG
jgi:selenocysteine lyase/cysteine desulfurase